jgi:hypothetical integral membrane protein (TIGR02206 family)
VPAASFQFWSPSHLVVLGLTAAVALGLGLARRGAWRGARAGELALAWGVLAAHPLALTAWWALGMPLDWGNLLPMHLCNWAGIAVWAALLWRSPLAAELAWFWAMSGTLQGLITPNQPYAFPHPTFFTFFLLHAGVVAGALHLVFGLGLHPRPGAWWRGILWTQGYVLAAAAVNWTLGANYAFLCAKPALPSLMDRLGDWPVYVGWLHLIGVAAIILLYLPFARPRRNCQGQGGTGPAW